MKNKSLVICTYDDAMCNLRAIYIFFAKISKCCGDFFFFFENEPVITPPSKDAWIPLKKLMPEYECPCNIFP